MVILVYTFNGWLQVWMPPAWIRFQLLTYIKNTDSAQFPLLSIIISAPSRKKRLNLFLTKTKALSSRLTSTVTSNTNEYNFWGTSTLRIISLYLLPLIKYIFQTSYLPLSWLHLTKLVVLQLFLPLWWFKRKPMIPTRWANRHSQRCRCAVDATEQVIKEEDPAALSDLFSFKSSRSASSNGRSNGWRRGCREQDLAALRSTFHHPTCASTSRCDFHCSERKIQWYCCSKSNQHNYNVGQN